MRERKEARGKNEGRGKSNEGRERGKHERSQEGKGERRERGIMEEVEGKKEGRGKRNEGRGADGSINNN